MKDWAWMENITSTWHPPLLAGGLFDLYFPQYCGRNHKALERFSHSPWRQPCTKGLRKGECNKIPLFSQNGRGSMINPSYDPLLCLCTIQVDELLCSNRNAGGASWLLHRYCAIVLQSLYPNPDAISPGHTQDFYFDLVSIQLPSQARLKVVTFSALALFPLLQESKMGRMQVRWVNTHRRSMFSGSGNQLNLILWVCMRSSVFYAESGEAITVLSPLKLQAYIGIYPKVSL